MTNPPGGQEARKGLIFGLAAYGMWGLFPLYWPLLKPAGATEILAHRMAWSLVVMAVLLGIRRNWSGIKQLRHTPAKVLLLCGAAILVSVNWGVYIWAVNKGHVVET
jgi:chloramphenicol-sensitive protein RarD